MILYNLQVLLVAILFELVVHSHSMPYAKCTYIIIYCGAPKIMTLTFTQGLDWWLFRVDVEVLVKVCSSPMRRTFIELFTKLNW